MLSEKKQQGKVIQVVIGKANPNRMNGVNNVVHNLSNELLNTTIEVEVWGITDLHKENSLVRNYKIQFFERFKFRLFPSFSLLKKILSQNKNEVIFHFHGSYIIEFFIFTLILKVFGFSWIVTPHGGYAKNTTNKNGFLKKIYIKTLDKLYIGKAKIVHLFITQETDDFHNWFPKVTTIYIPNGVNIVQEYINHPMSIDSSYFVYCGRLSTEKGLDRLLAGYCSYVKAGGKADLLIIGDGDKRIFIEEYIKKNDLYEKIKLTGAVFGKEKNKLISKAIACIATSYSEGFPIALLEALALNKPLIVSKETNIGELVKRHNLGICLDDCNQDKVCEAFSQMEENFAMYDFKPMNFINENYTWSSIAEQFNNEYRKLFLDLYKRK